jgi:hypothetical protein
MDFMTVLSDTAPIATVNWMFSALVLVGAIMVALVTLRVFDKLAGQPFRIVLANIRRHPRACAMYYGLRFLGVCLIVAAYVFRG